MQERKPKEDYENTYEMRREWLASTIYDKDDIKYPNIINYFCKSGKTPVTNSFTPKEESYPVTMNIREAFNKVQDVFMTQKLTKGKRATLKSSMESLSHYEEYLLISLLTYLREAYTSSEEEVLLTYKEYYLLKNSKFTKNKKK